MTLTIWPPDRDETDALVSRPYGAGLADLVVDFDRPLQSVISEVLKACLSASDGSALSDAEVERWTIAKRRQGLLAVAVATNGPVRWLTSECTTCGERLDLDVNLTDFNKDWRVEEVDFGEARLRLPCPSDLVDIGDDETRLAHTLLIGKPPSEPWQAEAESALDAADPLADLELAAACPECGAAVAMPLVLETYLIEELGREAIRLMDEIHVLALAYHWTEPEIIALPESRRHHYLARIREVWAA